MEPNAFFINKDEEYLRTVYSYYQMLYAKYKLVKKDDDLDTKDVLKEEIALLTDIINQVEKEEDRTLRRN